MAAENSESLEFNSFKVKPIGISTISTLVDIESLSSYSLPEETSNKHHKFTPALGNDKGCGVNREVGERQNSDKNRVLQNNTRRRSGNVVIDLDNTEDDVSDPSYLEAYMRFMYKACLSPLDPLKYLAIGGPWSWSNCAWNAIQKVRSNEDYIMEFSIY